MAEVNAVELRKFGEVTASVVDDENTSLQENEENHEDAPIFNAKAEDAEKASPVTSPIEKPAATETKPTEDKPIELAKIDDKDVGLDTFERTTDEKAEDNNIENDKRIKRPSRSIAQERKTQLSEEEQAREKFITICLSKMNNLDTTSRQEMRAKIEAFLDELSKIQNSQEKCNATAKFIADNKISTNEKEMTAVIDLYFNTIGKQSVETLTKNLISTESSTNNPQLSQKEIELAKYEHEAAKNIIFTRNTYQLGKLEEFADANIKYCLTSTEDYSDEELSKLLANLKYDMRHASSPEEAVEIASKFARDTRIKFDLEKLEKMVYDYAEQEGFSKENVKVIAGKFADMRTFKLNVALKMFSEDNAENERVRELLVKAFQADIDAGHNDLKEMILECVNGAYTEKEVKELIEQLEDFVKLHTEGIEKAVDEGNFSDKFKEYVKKQNEKILALAKKRTIDFIEAFFKTEVGQHIKRQAKYAIKEVKEAKKEYEKMQEATKKAQEEAKAAKAASEKAIKEAKEEEQKAEAIASKFGFKDLDFESLYKVVKQESPRQANNLLYAQADKKKAYWAEYDANVAQNHAAFLEGVAKKHFEFAQMKVAAAFAKMQALLSIKG